MNSRFGMTFVVVVVVIRIGHLLVLQVVLSNVLPYSITSVDRSPKTKGEESNSQENKDQSNVHHFILATVNGYKENDNHHDNNEKANLSKHCQWSKVIKVLYFQTN